MATYQLVALREAHNNFEDLESVLYNYPSGLQWVLYRESQISTAVDDYGLSLARLFATPLLSGLAGIGGVFLFSTLLVEPNSNSITNIFAVNRPDFVIAAAFFGLTPNLLIRGLQQRAEKYMSALKSSKGAVEETFDNGN